ncbi:MAG: hypothetical protein RIC06_12170 [Cyclobacteriaceae bacterium]
MQTINYSYRTLRRAIGILGILLPILLIVGNQFTVEDSISYYYYTRMSTVFTGILISFALILVTYRGTDPTPGNLNENVMTNFSGACAFIVALVPTKFQGSDLPPIFYTHSDDIRGWIHIGAAVIFFFLMGLVILTKFAKAPYYKTFYKVTGGLVMLGLIIAIVAFILKIDTGVFWGETLALWAFGAAWLRRGVPKNPVSS